MWQLELLSRVIPAFGALAKPSAASQHVDMRLNRDMEDCFNDFVLIGVALHYSNGEWTSGLSENHLLGLLEVLNTRIPTKWTFPPFPFTSRAATEIPEAQARFPNLASLAKAFDSLGKNGFDECANILSQSDETRKMYASLFGPRVSLFHKAELKIPGRRDKFLRRLRDDARHLIHIYTEAHDDNSSEYLSLSQHPSHGLKEWAERVYIFFEQHWTCRCAYRSANQGGAREARLNLGRYHHMNPKTSARTNQSVALRQPRFEILLPTCNDVLKWRKTTVRIRTDVLDDITKYPRKAVNNNICRYLLDSQDTLQIDFEIESGKLWHLKPQLVEGTNHYTTMEPLCKLLGDGFAISYFSAFKPLEQLTLCYLLATSMLYLYPSSWIHSEWASDTVYFISGSNRSAPPTLTFPYFSVDINPAKRPSLTPPDHMQHHLHPAILCLGIVFLEIITGQKFKKSTDEHLWSRCNKDNLKALQLLVQLEREDGRSHVRRLSTGLKTAIQACLKLTTPPNFPSDRLDEEGPIRHYILVCIVHPLVNELRNGYKVNLDDLQHHLEPPMSQLDSSDVNCMNSISHHAELNGSASTHAFSERREASFGKSRDMPIDHTKVKAADEWFGWHSIALARVRELRNSSLSNASRVKIAILDSGIQLSSSNKDIYDSEKRIQYKSWVDDKTGWTDNVGHGTHLATLILQVAPYAIVHVARVFEKSPSSGSEDKIAQAIRHAVDDWGVDIIVMSFGFGEVHEKIFESIQHAASKGILMFAAASNDGKNRPDGVAWPARDGNVICVHSADGYGQPSKFTPYPEGGKDIMVLGECVKSAWPEHLPSEYGQKRMSGTSCATPIAAGIAALILDHARGFLSVEEWVKLRRLDTMRKVLRSMSDRPPGAYGDGYLWVKHWSWFDSKNTKGWIEGQIRRML